MIGICPDLVSGISRMCTLLDWGLIVASVEYFTATKTVLTFRVREEFNYIYIFLTSPLLEKVLYK